MLSIIVAYDENRVIGCDNKLPWNIPEDLRHFKKMTSGQCVIMGRKTWDSLPKPLPNRDHYILTRSFKGVVNKIAPRIFQVNSLQWAIDLIRHSHPGKTGWVIGGAEIYKVALEGKWVDRIVATEIRGTHKGDVFFPEIGDGWEKIVVQTTDEFDIVWYVRM